MCVQTKIWLKVFFDGKGCMLFGGFWNSILIVHNGSRCIGVASHFPLCATMWPYTCSGLHCNLFSYGLLIGTYSVSFFASLNDQALDCQDTVFSSLFCQFLVICV